MGKFKQLKRKRDRYFNVVIERDSSGYYVASVPELHGCHTQAKSLDRSMRRIHEAIDFCLEVQSGSSGAEMARAAKEASE